MQVISFMNMKGGGGVGAQPFGCDEAAVGSLATVTCLWVGIVDGQFRVMHQRRGSRPWRTASVRASGIGRPRRRTIRGRSSRRTAGGRADVRNGLRLPRSSGAAGSDPFTV